MAINPMRGFVAGVPTVQAPQFTPLAAGNKHYGMGQRSAPNVGKVSSAGAAVGYNQRDAEAAARREALIRRAMGG